MGLPLCPRCASLLSFLPTGNPSLECPSFTHLIPVLLHPPQPPVSLLDCLPFQPPPWITHSQSPSRQVDEVSSQPQLSFSKETSQGLSYCSTPGPSSSEKAFSRFTQNRGTPHFLSVFGHAKLSGLKRGQNKDANGPLVNFKTVFSSSEYLSNVNFLPF